MILKCFILGYFAIIMLLLLYFICTCLVYVLLMCWLCPFVLCVVVQCGCYLFIYDIINDISS
jgi:hypothetical protein